MGEIIVYQYYGPYDRRPRGIIGPSSRNEWEWHYVFMPASHRPYQVVFEAIVGESYYSDMAIDDVIAPASSCAGKAGTVRSLILIGVMLETNDWEVTTKVMAVKHKCVTDSHVEVYYYTSLIAYTLYWLYCHNQGTVPRTPTR